MLFAEDAIQVGDTVYLMYWNSVQEHDGEKYYDDYVYKVKTKEGQTVKMEIYVFDEDYNVPRTIRWSVVLQVENKRKRGFEHLKQTGKSGLTPLLIAKEILKWHIDEIIKKKTCKFCRHNNVIEIAWDDIKRKNAYMRGLSDLGFKLEHTSYNKQNIGVVLLKTIRPYEKEEERHVKSS